MAKTRDQKHQIVADYKQKLKDSAGVILISPKGLTANEVNNFKQKVATAGNSYHVVKNTLFSIALDNTGMPELDTLAAGTHAALFISEDVAGAAKMLKELMKEAKDKISIKAGILDGQLLTVAQVEGLAEMPTKQQSVAIIAGILTQPMGGVVNVLEDSVRSVAIIINEAFKQ